jgi:rubredoxin
LEKARMQAFERNAEDAPPPPEAHMECGICWAIYDPAEGDDFAQVPPGTPFAALPAEWTCPNCDAPKHKFLRVAG